MHSPRVLRILRNSKLSSKLLAQKWDQKMQEAGSTLRTQHTRRQHWIAQSGGAAVKVTAITLRIITNSCGHSSNGNVTPKLPPLPSRQNSDRHLPNWLSVPPWWK